MWYVYVLENTAMDYSYLGSTRNLQRRLVLQNNGETNNHYGE